MINGLLTIKGKSPLNWPQKGAFRRVGLLYMYYVNNQKQLLHIWLWLLKYLSLYSLHIVFVFSLCLLIVFFLLKNPKHFCFWDVFLHKQGFTSRYLKSFFFLFYHHRLHQWSTNVLCAKLCLSFLFFSLTV